MVIKPHDLLRLKKENQLLEKPDLPSWLSRSVSDVRFVVVRRAPIKDGNIPIGIRGKSRDERFATFIPIGDIMETITPERLVVERNWKNHPSYDHFDALHALDLVESTMQQYQLSWGPTGSVGFELASGLPTVTETSDLDIIIRSEECISIETSREIVSAFTESMVRIDPIIEAHDEAFSLIEYSRGKLPIMIRTKDGPKLTSQPSFI